MHCISFLFLIHNTDTNNTVKGREGGCTYQTFNLIDVVELEIDRGIWWILGVNNRFATDRFATHRFATKHAISFLYHGKYQKLEISN
jgi:hypothetical protein